MKILQINNYEYIRGGSDRVYQLTCDLLIRQGHKVSSLTCGTESFDDRKVSFLLEENSYLNKNPLKVLHNATRFIFRQDFIKDFKSFLKNNRPDIIHLHIFYGQISSSILKIIKEEKIPCIMTVHEYRMLCPTSTLFNNNAICEKCISHSKTHILKNKCNRKSYLASFLSFAESSFRDIFYSYKTHIDRFLMVSNFCLDKHIEYIPEIESKSTTLYNFIPNKNIKDTIAIREKKYNGDYVYAGRISREKGIETLCKSFSERRSLKLKIIGEGPLLSQLKNQYKQYSNIIFMGKLDFNDLQNHLIDAKFSILPAEWYENNPMSILESFAVGTPCLGSKIGGIPELIIDNETGYLFNPSDKKSLIEKLDYIESIPFERYDRLCQKSFDLIKSRHTEEEHYKKLIKEYEYAINQKNK